MAGLLVPPTVNMMLDGCLRHHHKAGVSWVSPGQGTFRCGCLQNNIHRFSLGRTCFVLGPAFCWEARFEPSAISVATCPSSDARCLQHVATAASWSNETHRSSMAEESGKGEKEPFPFPWIISWRKRRDDFTNGTPQLLDFLRQICAKHHQTL